MAFLQQVFQVPSFVTGASLTSALELPGAFVFVNILVPTMSAGYSAASTPIWLQASDTISGTYYRFSNPETNTNTVGTNDFQVVSACSQRLINVPCFAFRYIKFEISGTCTTPASSPPFKIIAISNQ